MNWTSIRPFAARVHAWASGSRILSRGQDNRVELSDSIRRRCRIRILGHGNRVVFESGCRLWDLDLELVGNNHLLQLGSGCQVRGGRWVLEDENSSFAVGAQTTFIGGILIASEGTGIRIGVDCMFSSSVEIRSSDGHSILDCSTGHRNNPAADVDIGDHVWLGAGVKVMKGVAIGSHTVVAAGAIVTADLPEGSLAVGIPARVLRNGVTWDRKRLAFVAPSK